MTSRDYRAAALVGVVSIGLGTLVGVTWALLAGDRGPAGADLVFGALGLVAGFALAIGALGLALRKCPDGTFVGLVLGGLIGSLVARQTGGALSAAWTSAEQVSLDTPGALLLWPFATALVGLMTGAATRGRGREGRRVSGAGIPVEGAPKS